MLVEDMKKFRFYSCKKTRYFEYQVCISCYKKPGIYFLDPESSAGKSYLGSILREYGRLGEPVGYFTYEDELDSTPIESRIKQDSVLVVIDRYDMYNGKYSDFLYNLSKSCVVLVDCKNAPKLKYDGYESAILYRSKNEIAIV